MKKKSKNQSSERSRRIGQSHDSKLKTSFTLSFGFCFSTFCSSLLAFCFLASLSLAETPSEQLDPTNLLVPHLIKPLQYVNMPNVTAKTLQSPNTPNVAAETSQDVNTPNISKTSSHLFSVPKASAQTNKIPPAQKEQSQTSTDNAHIDKKLPQDSSTSTENSNSEVQRQLRLARIATPKEQNNQRSKSELQRLIEQIRNIEFKPQNQSPEPIIVVEPLPTIEPPAQTAEPDEMLSDTELPEEPEGKEIDSKLPPLLPCEPVTSQTLQMLENLSQHPDQLDNPFALAELLYLSGHLKEASVFYQEALNRSSPDRVDSAQNRAWILFQIGNCLRDDDPPMATKMYRQLIAEYPDSLWTNLAKTQDKLIDWYQKNKPQTLIAEKQL